MVEPPDQETLTQDLPAWIMAPGQVLGGRYEIRSLLGRGGLGEVWHAFDLKLRVEVALKALRPDLVRDERRLELARREVRAAREVVSPNVCRVFDLVEVEGHELVSMEYVDGQTLLEVLRERAPLPLKEAQDVASQFLAGLEAIHKAGIVHRDVKPENIMLTRAGRVVVMDLGLAKEQQDGAGSVSGTPAYMAPEQAAALAVDARADVYSAGVVLAEMVSPGGIKDISSRQSVWEAIRHEPAQVPDTPWAPVLKKAVAKQPEHRYATAHTLILALEDVTLRVEGAEDLHPYPGLASFTEADAEYFFGREAEVEAMWRRLDRPRLTALVGPSGAGKTSFLRAGLTPAAPAAWRIVRCTPGNAAVASLGRAMAREMAGDAEAMEQLLSFDDLDVAVELVARWRRGHEHVLLVVDQFEETFTLNSPEHQIRFAELLGRLPLEADTHVLLSMRDDFLARCNVFEPLRPIFHELAVIDPPAGANLRRALVQPATKCGYRFEDDALVEEMLAEVEGERGALPMLAFAAARLWERRDRENGLITRQAHRDIGGVAGALARHAETTIDRIGSDRIAIVRELFRNLVTAEDTRAVREWEELLSVFDVKRRAVAEEVLRELIDARLLTSYELREEKSEPARHVEIVHESLLANWPRFLRWQTQDADAAQLRDQLRQAARTWAEHNRSDDLLWTGSAFREYRVWRERYPGGLSEVEESFARAMTALATRRRRRRRLAVAAAGFFLAAVAVVFGALWRHSVAETQRAEAQYLLSLAREERRPERTLGYVIAALETADSWPARSLAVQVFRRIPPARVTHPGITLTAEFSPDGRWLAASDYDTGKVLLWPSQGGEPRTWQATEPKTVFQVKFTPDSTAVMTGQAGMNRFWSVPDGALLSTVRDPLEDEDLGTPQAWITAAKLVRIVRGGDGGWTLDLSGGERLLQIDPGLDLPADLSADGELVAYGLGESLYVERLSGPQAAIPRLVGRHDRPLTLVSFGPHGRLLAAQSKDGELRLWSLDGGSDAPLRRWPGLTSALALLLFSPDGSKLAVICAPTVLIFDLLAPPDAEPVSLNMPHASWLAFHPSGRWLAVANLWGADVLPVDGGRFPWVLRGHSGQSYIRAFDPQGRWLVSASEDGTVRWWPLAPSVGRASRVLFASPAGVPWVSVNSSQVALAWGGDGVKVIPVTGGPAIDLRGPGESLGLVALDAEGRYVAACGVGSRFIRLWSLATRELTSLDAGEGIGISGLRFVADGHLLVSHAAGPEAVSDLSLWDVATPRRELLFEGGAVRWDTFLRVSDDGRHLLGLAVDAGEQPGSPVYLCDLTDKTLRRLDGFTGSSGGLDPSGSVAATFDNRDARLGSFLQVGPVTAEHPHLVPYNLDARSYSVPFLSPGADRIAQGYDDGSIWLYPVPDLRRLPLHTLPREQLIARLKTFTNLRAVRDSASDTGWKLKVDPFPGWEIVPTW